ncbi:MAG: energy-coupling factor transporter ATPase [Pseudomonadota bacterium]
MNGKMVIIEDLWWRYEDGEDWVLKGIDLEIGEGEVVGVIGPTGAGKTTLCLAIAGLIPHAVTGKMNGSVYVAGVETKTVTLKEIVRRVCMLFQNPESQFVSMSVLDEVAFGLENFGYSYEEMLSRIQWALKVVGLSGYEDKHPLAFSSGQKQRLALASILALRPNVLVLDEPLSNLDGPSQEEVFSTIHDLKETFGTTAVIVEHNTEELINLVDRLVLLNKGGILHIEAPQRFFQGMDSTAANGVWLPQVTELGYRLSESGLWKEELPVTLEAAQDMIGSLVTGKSQSAPTLSIPHLFARPFQISNDLAIEIRHLSYAYPDGSEALRDINLVIGRGEYIALLGKNGSGKTTLAKHSLGLLRPTSGQVTIHGVDTRQVSTKELVTRVGYIFQNPDHQLFCTTIEEEVAYGLKNLGLRPEEIERRVHDALIAVELAYPLNFPVFSLGEAARQKIALASVLAMQPDILIVDEPSSCKDKGLSDLLMRILRNLNASGKNIILITHNMRLLTQDVERVVMLDEGRIVLDAPIRMALAKAELMKRAGLKLPQITQMAHGLANFSFPVHVSTVDEAFKWVCIACGKSFGKTIP